MSVKNLPNDAPFGSSSSSSGGGSGTATQFEGFSVHLNADATLNNSDTIGGWNFNFNPCYYTSPNFNLSSGLYTAPMAGHYSFNISGNSTGAGYFAFLVNGVRVKEIQNSDSDDGFASSSVSVYLMNTDTVEVKYYNTQPGPNTLFRLNSPVISTTYSGNRLDSAAGGGSSVSLFSDAPSTRYIVNPASNPGITGGLLVSSTSSHTPNIFQIPLTDSYPGLAGTNAEPYNNSKGVWTLSNSTITFNRTGYFIISMDIDALTNDNISFLIQANSGTLLLAPPLLNSAGNAISELPPTVPYLFAFSSGESVTAYMQQGDTLTFQLTTINSTTPYSFEIPLSSSVSVLWAISGGSVGPQGVQGQPGAPGLNLPLTAGSGLFIPGGSYDGTVATTISSIVDVTNDGPGTSLLAITSATPNFKLKSIQAGDNVSFANSTGQNLVIDVTNPPDFGLSVGAGLSLSSGNPWIPSDQPATLTTTINLANGGTGASLVESTLLPNLRTKGLIAGPNITLTPSLSDVTISSTPPALFNLSQGGGITITPNPYNPASAASSISANVAFTSQGAGNSLVATGSSSTSHLIKSIVAGTNVTVVSTGSTLTINSTPAAISLTSTSPLLILSPATITGVGNFRVRMHGFCATVNPSAAVLAFQPINTWVVVGFTSVYSQGINPFLDTVTIVYSGAYQINFRIYNDNSVNFCILDVQGTNPNRYCGTRQQYGGISESCLSGTFNLTAGNTVRILCSVGGNVTKNIAALPALQYGELGTYWSMSYQGPIV